MGLRAGVASDRGLVRTANEDSFFLREGLYAVCDGMGGARGGEVASQMACLGLLGVNPASAGKRELQDAVESANRAIVHRSAGEDHLMGMGTTMTAALITGKQLTLAHVGDSRAYLLREADLTQLTEDHSWVAEMVRRGDLTPAQAAVHPHRSVITRALGTDGEVEPDITQMEVTVGDRILLCSDGLTGMIGDTDILEILAANENAQTTAEMLIRAALEGGGEDNITVIVIDVTEGDDTSTEGETDAHFSSQILFGPSDRGGLVAASSHKGRAGAGVRDFFGRRTTPPARPARGRAESVATAVDEPEGGAARLVPPPGVEEPDRAVTQTGTESGAAGGVTAPAANPDPAVSATAAPAAALDVTVIGMKNEASASAAASSNASAVAPADAQEAPASPGTDAGAILEAAVPETGTFDDFEAAETAAPLAAGTSTETAPAGAGKKSRGRPGRLRLFVIVGVAVVALALAIGGFGFYNSTIYYLGKASDGTIALYRGLPESVLGIDLSSAVKLGTKNYDSLTAAEKLQVDSHRLVSEEEGQMLLGSLGL